MKHYIDTNNEIWGFDNNQTALIPNDAVEIPSSYTAAQYPFLSLKDNIIHFDNIAYIANSNSEKLNDCKFKAKILLSNTDWATLFDVASGSPCLTNQSDFIKYREAVRKLVVSPVLEPEWPEIPVAQWS